MPEIYFLPQSLHVYKSTQLISVLIENLTGKMNLDKSSFQTVYTKELSIFTKLAIILAGRVTNNLKLIIFAAKNILYGSLGL